MTFFSRTKQFLLKRVLPLITFSYLINLSPLLSSHSGPHFTPTKYLVKFYQMGLINPQTLQAFEILNSSTGVEVDLSKKGNVSTLARGVKPLPGTYTHIYGLVSNTYVVAGSNGTCYTKAGSYNKSSVLGMTGWAAVTTNKSESGEAVITEQSFLNGNANFGPVTPNTLINVQGNPVTSMALYLTNSSNPYVISNNPNRSLYLGELPSPITVNNTSKGEIIITFDSTNGGSFDNNCALGLDLIDNKFGISIIQK